MRLQIYQLHEESLLYTNIAKYLHKEALLNILILIIIKKKPDVLG